MSEPLATKRVSRKGYTTTEHAERLRSGQIRDGETWQLWIEPKPHAAARGSHVARDEDHATLIMMTHRSKMSLDTHDLVWRQTIYTAV